ncbi:heavy metal translocating P-type ATPase [Fulvimarina sp. 2208YS6-2-32]|uniref:Heavy metal translocating P-type ATPase n=1 Tax=Fulvimarina uroteuthidis TaxID=3098149 RepID=A0ABU5I524_9HYPH|nr:heavy metal translocating P-type ATPase [Fulvimarina sp. 2208YS6-2-32]MDY8109823.1 heavy metal translocating P-type ATPase [Fulvimarina sp. 2208YS6-2-32]
MSCCSAALAGDIAGLNADPQAMRRREELRHAGRVLADGGADYVLSVPAIHCGKCISVVEDGLAGLDGVETVRVNLTLKRVSVRVAASLAADPLALLERLDALGYPATPVDLGDLSAHGEALHSTELLKALAVAGFGSANVMLLSVSVWSGADAATRDAFHLVSALITVPAIAYSGRVFFRSAISALRQGRLNMDVPISLAILLAVGMSLGETLTGGKTAYFDAALMLTFFLLIGRCLDERMRERARSAVTALARLSAKGATIVEGNQLRYAPLDEIRPGTRLRFVAGERLAVDAVVVAGTGFIDRSLVTGESVPVAVQPGDRLEAGVLNLSGPIEVEALRDAGHSFLAEIQRMMTAAEVGRGRRSRIADEIARIYAPAVHLIAAATFLLWIIAGGGWYEATYAAISVLIVTCPCALALAVPVVHVVAASRLFEHGILMKDGTGLEKLNGITHAIFDKTGTLTQTVAQSPITVLPLRERRIAAALTRSSSHPVCLALADRLKTEQRVALDAVREYPGLGLEARYGALRVRLGRGDWVAEIAADPSGAIDMIDGTALAIEGETVIGLAIAERLRDGARDTIPELASKGISAEILSGDADGPVRRIASLLKIPYRAGQTPKQKLLRIEALKGAGARVLMVGDGLNDAPSLSAGDVSMAPGSACDIGRLAADFVFTRDDLSSVTTALEIARRAHRLVAQNFAMAFGYNVIAVPLAVAGLITPLIAAIAMSLSSILVVANSLRLASTGAPWPVKTQVRAPSVSLKTAEVSA